MNCLTKVLPPEIEEATWSLPTISQWRQADALKLLVLPKDGDMEWTCSRTSGWDYFIDAISLNGVVKQYKSYKFYLRPVINIKMKKS